MINKIIGITGCLLGITGCVANIVANKKIKKLSIDNGNGIKNYSDLKIPTLKEALAVLGDLEAGKIIPAGLQLHDVLVLEIHVLGGAGRADAE